MNRQEKLECRVLALEDTVEALAGVVNDLLERNMDSVYINKIDKLVAHG